MNSLLPLLASKSRLTLADTAKIVQTAPIRYKIYTIPRRSGGKRVIAHPAKELKVIQRALIDLFSEDLPVSKAATAYERGCSIKINAELHKQSRWIAKFDLRNFFNSIKECHWIEFLEKTGIDYERIELSRTVFFWQPKGENSTCLSVGAPSSPFASNRFMLSYDDQIATFCKDMGFVYSRYADDITVSGSRDVDPIVLSKRIKEIIEGPGVFSLHEEKSRFMALGCRRSVTGVIITNDGVLSIGRNRRRKLEARVHRFGVTGLNDNVDELRGELAFFKMIDEDGFHRLRRRFGELARVRHAHLF
jgi:hypothetical protein